MALILQVVAGILVLIGAGTLYWGTDPALLSLGNTVMIVGAVIGASGIVLFGLGVVAGQVARLGQRLDLVADALAAGRRTEVSAAPLAPAALPRDVEAMAPLPPDLDLGLTDPPRPAAPVITPPAPPVRSEPVAAPVPAPAPTPVPPSRQSFGLPPLTGQAPFGVAAAGVAAGAVAGGLAAGLASSARSEPAIEERSAEKPVPSEPVAIEPVVLEPVKVEPVIPAIVVPDKSEPDMAKDDDDLAHAVEDLKDEVKAAEADLAPSPAAAEETPDHLASLERILLGAAAEGRAPAAPEPEPLVLPPHREPEPIAADEAEEDDTPDDDAADAEAEEAQAPAAEPDPVIGTDDFMARLRETLARPVAPPQPAPAGERLPEPADEARHAPKPSPVLSIEEELERALQASLTPAPAPVAAAPAPVVAPAPVPVAPPRIEPEPPAPARDVRPPDAMAALAKDFPELNDILAPKAPPADPAASLLDDLKGIFAEPKASPSRPEPAVAAPPPPPAPSTPPLLREGVIAGIPFRLYGDGTIEADLAEGTTRFASLKDFRAHVGG